MDGPDDGEEAGDQRSAFRKAAFVQAQDNGEGRWGGGGDGEPVGLVELQREGAAGKVFQAVFAAAAEGAGRVSGGAGLSSEASCSAPAVHKCSEVVDVNGWWDLPFEKAEPVERSLFHFTW